MATAILCEQCQSNPAIIFDNRAGHIICSECGLFLGLIHDFAETSDCNRSSADSSSDSIQDKDERERGDANYTISDNEYDEIPESQSSFHESSEHSDETESANYIMSKDYRIVTTPGLKRALKRIGVMADRLGISRAAEETACDIYKDVDSLKTCRGRSMNSILAACLYIACRKIKLCRTLKEISSVANGVPTKDINRTIEAIKRQIVIDTRSVEPAELVKRFCNKLGITKHAIEAVQETVQRAEELDIRRSPKAILAAIIYMITQLSHEPEQVSINDIAMATEVTELTIRKTYRDISHEASRIIPEWYANKEDIGKIPKP